MVAVIKQIRAGDLSNHANNVEQDKNQNIQSLEYFAQLKVRSEISNISRQKLKIMTENPL